MESNSIPFINSIHDFFSKFSCFCSHPLFSTLVTLYTLIFLYAPSSFLSIVLSPVLNSTGIILLFLLKLGASERSGNDLSSEQMIILSSSTNERLEKESGYLEARVLDHKDKCYDHLSNDGGNLTSCSRLFLESISLEQRFVEFLDHNQNNINFEAKVELRFRSNQTSMESKHGSNLDLESNQMNVEFEHELGLESNFQDDCYKGELLGTNSMKSSQVVEPRMEMDSIQVDSTMKFLEWNMKAPLDIIYEAYEGEEDEDDDSNKKNMYPSYNKHVMGRERYPSLSMYYPESSSDDDFSLQEQWETQESVFFKWETEDDERDELIEISLDPYGKKSIEFCQDEEDSLIEIDIFPQEAEW